MTVFIATFIVIAIAIAGMAIGVIMGRPSIKGSCGGLGHLGLSGSCGGACSAEKKKTCQHRKAAEKPE